MDFYYDSFIGSDEKSDIACCFCIPDDTPRGVIQIAHGMCECMADYRRFAEFFTAYGYIVCGNDALGHGQTAGTVNRLGYFAERHGSRYLVGDFIKMNRLIRRKYPTLPIFALGHSMGSFILRVAITRTHFDCAGALLLGTSAGYGMSLFLTYSTLLLRTAYGGRYRDEKRLNTVCRFLCVAIRHRRSDFSWVSRDINAVRECENRFFIMTASAYYDVMALLNIVSDKKWAEYVRADIPIAIMCGENDPVGNYGADARLIYNRLAECGVKKLSLRIYRGARHELLHEYNTGTVCEDILGILERLRKGR